ncbi:MAG TPA: hypothetical protein VJN96_16070 [Vicinamibacterales bacterium]|nr:hypothetical protein [Vicinamibacterales bacterium]
MPAVRYTATRVRDEGRDRYSVIFRHPVRLDSAGRSGRRVKRGLGTTDEFEADRIVAQINEILGDEQYWNLTARPTATARFHEKAVSAFYDGMEPRADGSSRDWRDALLPLPQGGGYRQILMLGTTGAGKTTVVRQILGTHPVRERFPAASTAKTTTADTEVIVAPDGPFRAVVTFVPRDEVMDRLLDCASRAALAILRNAPESEIRRLLLDHEDQRFRFSYALGRATGQLVSSPDSFAEFDEIDPDSEDGDFDAKPETLKVDLAETNAVIGRMLVTLKDLVRDHEAQARSQLGVRSVSDERVAQEILEEELDALLRADERFNDGVDEILREIEKRFGSLDQGEFSRDQQAWPRTWSYESEDRRMFLRLVNRFASNYAPLFGQLLTPLVDGIRVQGRFSPSWCPNEHPPLVLVDGEGLGHTPRSSASIPTAVARRIEEADTILLVDSAAQPMQAAPAAAVRSILTSGNIAKLVFCFTHFDAVKGDNLRSAGDRARHVMASVENLVAVVRDEFGPRSERVLRRQLQERRFFLAHTDQILDSTTKLGERTTEQLRRLLTLLTTPDDQPNLGASRPVYDKANVVLAVASAATSFHRRWRAILGIAFQPDVDREHWARVKALNRRFAEGAADQYNHLRPSADLRELLKDAIYKTLEKPLRWRGPVPDDDTVTTVINEMSQAVAKRLIDVIYERLSVRPTDAWQDAYALRGPGSTFERATTISDGVFSRHVPIPGSAASPDQNEFLHAVIRVVEEAAAEIGAELA